MIGLSILKPKIPKKIKIQKSSWNTKKSSLPFCAIPPLLPKKRTTNNELKKIHILSCSSFNFSIVLAISINKKRSSSLSLVMKTSLCQKAARLTLFQHGMFFMLLNLSSVHFAAGNSRQQEYLKIFVRCEVRFNFVTFFYLFFLVPLAFFRYKTRLLLSTQFFYKIQKKDSLS